MHEIFVNNKGDTAGRRDPKIENAHYQNYSNKSTVVLETIQLLRIKLSKIAMIAKLIGSNHIISTNL